MKLAARLNIPLLLLAIVSVAVIGFLAYRHGRRTIEENTFSRLISTTALRANEFERWLEGSRRSLRLQARRPLVRQYVAEIVLLAPTDPAYQQLHDWLVHNHLVALVEEDRYLTVSILRGSDGLILVSTDKQQEGQNRGSEPYFLAGQQDTFVDSVRYDSSLGQAALYISTPIYDAGGKLAAVLVGRSDLDEMTHIMLHGADLSASEESYLINQANFFVTEPRFGRDFALRKTVHTDGVTNCLAHNNGVGLYLDYRAVPVIGAYQWLPERELCLLTEVDQAEAFAPIVELRRDILIAGGGIGLAFALLGLVLARTITRPVQQLVMATEEFGRGNLAHSLELNRADELGRLAVAFNSMAGQRQRVEDELRQARDELELRVQARTAELAASEHKYRQLAETAQDIILTHNLDGQITYLNPAGVELSQCSAGETLQMNISDFVPPADWEQMVQRQQRRLNGDDAVLRFETELIKKDGTRIPLEVVSSLLTTADQPGGVLILARDISLRRQAAERFRLIVESIPNAIVVVDEAGEIVLVNSQTETLFGYDRDELMGQPVELLVPARFKQDHSIFRAGFGAAPQARAMGQGRDLYGLHKDGREIPVEIGLSPMQSEAGLLVLSVIIDVSARKQAEEILAQKMAELARSNQELEQFAYVASHDLQEPLRMVASYLQLLERRYRDKLDADATEFIGYAVDGARRMKALINDLLAFSRVGTRGRPFIPTDCNLVLEQTRLDLSEAIKENQAVITSDDLPAVLADEIQLAQLFQNLIGNALKFRGNAPPQIHVGVSRTNSEWTFSVRDNGIGLEPQFAERIFIIFQRLHGKREYSGTGIGLAICKKIVERHGGRIWVESQPEQGATFYFTLPANQHDIGGGQRFRHDNDAKRVIASDEGAKQSPTPD